MNTAQSQKKSAPWIFFAVGYVFAVLAVDTLATQGVVTGPIDWRICLWRGASGFDWFKFTFWFAVPFILCIPRMDWGAFGTSRWRKRDLSLLAALSVVGMLAVLTVRVFPSLDRAFPGLGDVPWSVKGHHAQWFLAWTFSWIVGWEFLHRYFLLRRLSARWRWGWLIVPVSEGLYHLQQPIEMAAGMVLFSLVLTPWALRRKNILLPLLAHLIIELELELLILLG
ncbi:MAG: CPBP family intramembrane metalloprotease [bacterium]|nr:CPBP family intramembrane metalloprotease [bacterium]